VDLYKNSLGNVFSAAMSSALLFQKLNIKFAECPQLPNHTRPDCYEVLLDEEKQEFSLKQLSEEDYKAAQGTNKIIKCVQGAIYTIEKIDDIELPKPMYRSIWDYIHEEKAKKDFKEEMKIASEWEAISESDAR
ncbi:MAG TPA: hypothetical protein VFF04_07245, partial [Candidatus Babeliales bacterium]|nr:hypothetical protein [Candidatus Babeliales bacterium]